MRRATTYRSLGRIVAGFLMTAASITVLAAGGKVTDPNGIAPDRYVYYPGTEALARDDVRLGSDGRVEWSREWFESDRF